MGLFHSNHYTGCGFEGVVSEVSSSAGFSRLVSVKRRMWGDVGQAPVTDNLVLKGEQVTAVPHLLTPEEGRRSWGPHH